MMGDPKDHVCACCKKRPAVTWFCAEGGALAFVHGMAEPRCQICVVEEQLLYAWEALDRVKALEAEYAQLQLADERSRFLAVLHVP